MHVKESTSVFPFLSIQHVLPLIILLEGFASIATEILTIRQLLPMVGSSVIVTSIIIGIFLLFLALGYHRGGQLKGNLQRTLSINFLIAAIWFGIGLSYLFIAQFFNIIEKITSDSVMYPLVAYLLLVIAPLIYVLGQTIPVSMNMVKQNGSLGAIGGSMLGLSTLGSFLGATITAVLFMHYLGVAATIFIVFAVLLGLSLLLISPTSNVMMRLGIALIASCVIYYLNIAVERELFSLTNNYANYQLMQGDSFGLKDGEKILTINRSYSSFINQARKGFPYIETIKSILFYDLELRDSDVLVLGAGGFTLSAESDYTNRFTYVDIDRQLRKVVRPEFLEKINGKLIIDDARHFIHATKNRYHAIVVDTYSDKQSIPAHLLTLEFMAELKQRLQPNGVVIFNIIANSNLHDRYSKRIDNTIRAVFKNCMVVPLSYRPEKTNILYTCYQVQREADAVRYSDNLNTSTVDFLYA